MSPDKPRWIRRMFIFIGAVGIGASLPINEDCLPPCEEYEVHPAYDILTDRPD